MSPQNGFQSGVIFFGGGRWCGEKASAGVPPVDNPSNFPKPEISNKSSFCVGENTEEWRKDDEKKLRLTGWGFGLYGKRQGV